MDIKGGKREKQLRYFNRKEDRNNNYNKGMSQPVIASHSSELDRGKYNLGAQPT